MRISGKSPIVPEATIAFLNEIAGDTYLDPVINIPFFMHFGNANGQVVIGERLFSIRKTEAVVISLDDLQHFGDNPELAPSADIFPIDVSLISSSIESTKGNVAFNTGDYSPRRRVRGEIEANIGFLGEVFGSAIDGQTIRVRTKHYRRGSFGIFYGEKADELRHRGDVVENITNTVLPFDRTAFRQQRFNSLVRENSFGIQLGTGGSTHNARDKGRGSCQVFL